MINLEVRCPFCGAISNIPCDEDALAQYDAGALVQDAFPQMDLVTREILVSGMCRACQSRFFGEEDDYDREDACTGGCDNCMEFDCLCHPDSVTPFE